MTEPTESADPSRFTDQALREIIRAAGPAGITVRRLLEKVRATFPHGAIGACMTGLYLSYGVDAGWYVGYEPGTPLGDADPVEEQTYVAAEHAEPGPAELLHCIAQALAVGQRHEDLAEWISARFPSYKLGQGQLDWWLGELAGEKKIVLRDRGTTTHYVAVEHADTRPAELGRLRLPVQITEYTRWLNALDSHHNSRVRSDGESTGYADSTHLREETMAGVTFIVFYDRPVT